MRVLAAAVLTMESILMGFALLIAKDDASLTEIILGAVLAILFIFNAGLLKREMKSTLTGKFSKRFLKE